MGLDVHTTSQMNGSNFNRQDRVLMGMLSSLPTPPSSTSVTVLGAITPGSGFTNINTVTIAPTGGTGSGCTVIPTSLKAVSATVVNQGTSGFAVSDTITLSNGVVLTVASVSSGKPATATIATAGSFTGQVATNPVSQVSTSGAGVGTTTWTLSYGLGSAQITNSGTYSVVPTGMTVTDTASGTGASLAAPTLGGNGNPVYVNIPFELPATYCVQIEPGQSCQTYVPPTTKSNSGFTVALVPPTTSSTLAAGTVDVLVTA